MQRLLLHFKVNLHTCIKTLRMFLLNIFKQKWTVFKSLYTKRAYLFSQYSESLQASLNQYRIAPFHLDSFRVQHINSLNMTKVLQIWSLILESIRRTKSTNTILIQTFQNIFHVSISDPGWKGCTCL